MPTPITSYKSTRNPSHQATFQTALLSGYAPDGGLYVPSTTDHDELALPQFSREDLARMMNMDYGELAYEVLRSFIPGDEISNEELKVIIGKTYLEFPDPKNCAPVKKMKADTGVYACELWHGPTQCFKDLGLLLVINLLSHFTPPTSQKRTLLVSTSGDTGPAAVNAVQSVKNDKFNIVVSYPKGQISEYQRRQMTTIHNPNVKIIEFVGGGDDMDGTIKRLSQDAAFKAKHGLCGINSYNIGRPLAQIVHYFWSFLRIAEDLKVDLVTDLNFKIDVVIPTGAMGNITSSYISKKSGLPIHSITACVNDNDITYRTFRHGDFSKSEKMEKTLSDAINIQVPYNMERVLYYLTTGSHPLINEWMTQMSLTSSVQIPSEWIEKLKDTELFGAEKISDTEMCNEIKSVLEDNEYYIDPHTAVGFAGARKAGLYSPNTSIANDKIRDRPRPVVIMCTASACKFQESCTIAAGTKAWGDYYDGEDYPKRGKDMMMLEEVELRRIGGVEGETEEERESRFEIEMRKFLEE